LSLTEIIPNNKCKVMRSVGQPPVVFHNAKFRFKKKQPGNNCPAE